MMNSKLVFTNTLLAGVATAFGSWLSADFRPDGVLSWLQTLMQPFMFLPYIAGSIFGGNVHSPDGTVFAVTLFLEFFVLFTLLTKLLRRKRRSA